MTVPPRSLTTAPAARAAALTGLLLTLVVGLLAPLAPAGSATAGYLCTGYRGCAQSGYPHHGYKKASSRMWWRMFSGHNCTNYVAYRLVDRGMSSERPWDSTGMAYNWGRANRDITDGTPAVGAVAWWNAYDGVGSSGHVAYVEEVISSSKIVISEDSWGGDFHWRVVTRDGGRWPTGFIHFKDEQLQPVTAPSITGAPRVGRQLTADLGQWSPTGSHTVQWLAGRTRIPGATATTFTPGPDLLHKRLRVRVTASAPGYDTAVVTATRRGRVRHGLMEVAEPPALTGTPRVDQVLTLDPGVRTPAPDGTSISWFADGTLLEGQTGLRLRLGQKHIGKRVTGVMVSRREGYRRLRVATAPSAPVQAGRFTVSTPFGLAGRPRLGATLTVRPGVFEPADARVGYTWLRDGQPIAGAAGPTYTPVPEDVGHSVAVRVDLNRTGYQTHSATVTPRSVIRTRPTLVVRAKGRPHRAVVRVAVRAPGVSDPGGQATVRVGRGEAVRSDVVDGRLRLVVRGLSAGTRAVRAWYHGTEVVLRARARTTVHVPRRR